MEIKVNDFFAKRQRMLEGLHNLLNERIVQEKEKARQVAENHKLKAIEDSKLKADFRISHDFFIPKGYYLPQRVVYVYDGSGRLLLEMPPEAGRNIAFRAIEQCIGKLLDVKV